MNTNPILDDNFFQEKQNSKEFKPRYDAYFDSLKAAFRWRLVGMGATLLLTVNYLIYTHTDLEWAGNSLFYLFFAVIFLLGVAYFTHFFALQKGAVVLYLFPTANIGQWKTYNPWLLFGLSISLYLVGQTIQFPRGEIFIHFSQLVVYTAALHACFAAMQQLLLQKYKSYLPSFFAPKEFPSIGFLPALCFLMGIVLFVLWFFVLWASVSGPGHPELGIWVTLSFFATIINFFLAFSYIALHQQAEKHKSEQNEQ